MFPEIILWTMILMIRFEDYALLDVIGCFVQICIDFNGWAQFINSATYINDLSKFYEVFFCEKSSSYGAIKSSVISWSEKEFISRT